MLSINYTCSCFNVRSFVVASSVLEILLLFVFFFILPLNHGLYMNYGFYIFGVRAYTINGPGNWRVIANETLPLPLVTTLTETGINQ